MRRQWLEFNVRREIPNIEIVSVGTFMISIFIGKDMDGKDQKLISSKNNRPSLIADHHNRATRCHRVETVRMKALVPSRCGQIENACVWRTRPAIDDIGLDGLSPGSGQP